MDIEKVLKKYQLQALDIDWAQINKLTKFGNRKKTIQKSNSASKITAKRGNDRDKRKSVVPKYSNPNGRDKWTGRGRAPRWVINICEQENIDVKDFKIDPRFKA